MHEKLQSYKWSPEITENKTSRLKRVQCVLAR